MAGQYATSKTKTSVKVFRDTNICHIEKEANMFIAKLDTVTEYRDPVNMGRYEWDLVDVHVTESQQITDQFGRIKSNATFTMVMIIKTNFSVDDLDTMLNDLGGF